MTILERGLDDLVAAAAEHAEQQAERRRLDDDVVAGIASSGLNRALLPAALGGDERHPAEVIDAVMRLAAVDGSAGWCAAISAGSNLFAGYVREEAARRDFVDPDAGGAGMFAAMGVVRIAADGGAPTLTGRWPFASNCVHARWIGLGAFVEHSDGTREPVPRLVIVPSTDVVVEDTWYGSGLRATGSHHVRVDGVAVDLDRSCTFVDRAWAEGPLWRMPLFTVLGPVLGAAILGMARGAVDALHRRVMAGEAGGTRGPLADDPVGLAELAIVDTSVRAARAGLLDAVADVWAVAERGERASGVLQARTMLAVHHLADVAVEATSVAHRLCGGSAAYLGHPVLTALRDVETARQHIMFAHVNLPGLMRISAGVPEVFPPFVL